MADRVFLCAGNRITAVDNLSSLMSLTELNLRRNCIENVSGLHKLPALQRVFLSHNQIRSVADIACLFEVSYLIELSLDGNPLSDADPVRYRSQVVQGMAGLRHLDLKRVTEEERAAVNATQTATHSAPLARSSEQSPVRRPAGVAELGGADSAQQAPRFSTGQLNGMACPYQQHC